MIMYLLDKQQRIIKAIDKVIIEATMVEEINTANQLTFSVMTNSRIDTAIQYVCIPAPRGDAFLMFKLISETVKNDRVEYTAVESAYDELKAYSYIKDMRPSSKTAGQMLEQVIQGTRWSLGYIADTNQSSTSFYYITVLEAIQKIVELFNVELTFDVNIDKKTNVISSRRINLYTQQGERTGKRFEYGSNLLEVTREQSSENLITALVGRGKGEEVSQGEDGSPDGYGRRITFADVEWKRANGNPADKPRGQEYVEDKDATALYGFSDGRPRIGLTTFEDITDPQELLKATWASLQIAKRPQVAFKASVLDVGNLGLGDTVAIIRHDLGIEYFTRVYKVEHDLLNKANNTIELGDDFSQKSLTNYVADVAKITKNVKNTAEYAVSSASGKNKNYYSRTKPQYANEGDNLFLDLGNGETELYAWHNGNWELVVSTADTTAVKRQVERAQADLAQVRADATRISETQTESAKRLDEQMQELRAKTSDNATNVQNVIRDVAQAHADYVAQQADISKQKADLEKTKQSLQTTSQGLDQARQDLLSNSTRLDKLEVGVDGVTVNVNNLNTKVDNIKIGGTNLLKGTSRDLQQKSTTNDWVRLPYATNFFKSIYPLDNFTARVWIEKPDNDSWLQIYIRNNGIFIGNVIKAGQSGYSEVHGTLNNPTTNANLVIGAGDGLSVSLSWKELKLEKGTIATDWSPAPEDEIERVTQLKVDLDGIRGTVANTQGDIAQIKLTENGIQQNIRDAQGNISSLQNDAKQFKQHFSDVDGNIANLSASAKNFELQMQDAQGNISSLQNDAKGFEQQFADTNGNIATIKRNAAELSEQLASKVGNTEYQNFKTQTAKELSEKLVRTDLNGYATTAEVKLTADSLKEQYNSVNSKVDGLKIGGVNLLNSTKTLDKMEGNVSGGLRMLPSNINKGSYNGFTTSIVNAGQILPYAEWGVVVEPEETYTLSFYAKGERVDAFFYGPDNYIGVASASVSSGGYAYNTDDGHVNFSLTSEFKRYWVTWKLKARTSDSQPLWKNVLLRNNSGLGPNEVYGWQLEKGTIPSDWGPSAKDVEDAISGVSKNLTSYKAVVERDYAKNSSVYTKDEVVNLTNNSKDSAVNAIKNDTNWKGLVNINTNSAFLQTADGFEKEVVKKATSMVEGGGVNLAAKTSKDLQNVNITNMWLFVGGSGRPCFNDLSSYQGKHITVRVWIERPTADAWVQIWTNKGTIGGNHIKAGQSGYSTASGVIPTGFTDWNIPIGGGARTMSLGWKEFKVELGKVATPWTPAPEDLATVVSVNKVIDTADSHTQIIKDYLTNDNSQFKLLKNAVNLKVEKGDVIGQINLEAGKTLIQNQKVYLDADTVAFSGKAFIPSAAITNLSADKITTGTLNAAAVKVINIDASKITTGTLTGPSLKLDLKTGEVLFSKGRITGPGLDMDLSTGTINFNQGRLHDYSNNIDISIDDSYISSSDGRGRVVMRSGRLFFTESSLWDESREPYLVIQNGINGMIGDGASINARKSISITNSSSTGFSPVFDVGQFGFSGFYVGQNSDKWIPTVVGGQNRGVFICGGLPYGPYVSTTPSILVGCNSQGQMLCDSGWGDGTRIYLRGNFVHIPSAQYQTTSAGANVHVADDGALVRSTSAAKYKTNIVDATGFNYGDKLINLTPKLWLDKAEQKRYQDDPENNPRPNFYYGLIADELSKEGLSKLVVYNSEGEVEGINYDRIAVALLPVIKKLKDKIKILEEKINE